MRLDELGNRAVLTRPAAPVSIPALFADQVARTPEAVALVCGSGRWTYRELDEASNRLAHWLAGHASAPDGVWRCCFPARPRRLWRCWRCSRPGRPICRSTPRCRQPGCDFMIADAAPVAAVTTTALRRRLHARTSGDRHRRPRIDSQPRTRRRAGRRRPRPHHLHLGHHRRAQRRGGHPPQRHPAVRRPRRRPAPAPGQVWTQCHSYAFDFSVWEIWGALLHGGAWSWCPNRWRAPPRTSMPYWSPSTSPCSARPRRGGSTLSRGVESVALMAAGEACPAEVVDGGHPGG